MNDRIPSAASALIARQLYKIHQIKFVRPTVENGDIMELLKEDTVSSPAARTMSARSLSMKAMTMTPVHVHQKKEKIYNQVNRGSFEMFMFKDGRWAVYVIDKPHHWVAVPAGVPHALLCLSVTHDVPANIIVTASSQEPTDIEWEDAADQLLTNLHVH